MEVETNSTEDASTVRAASTESIKNIVSVEINFPQKNGNDVNSKYALAEEETRKADSDKTGEISETRPYGIFQESGKACEESGKQMGYQACDDSYSKESKIFRKTDSEALVMETLPKSSELEDESTSISSKLAINQGENVEKSFEKETCSEEELRAIDNNQSSRPQNEHGQSSKPLEAYDITQCESKESGENEQSDYQSVAPGMENVIAKHSSSEEKLTMESRINTNNDVEAQEKTTESYSSSEIKDGEKIMPEKAMDLKGATEAELQKPETESVPEDKALSVLPTTTSITLKGVGESIQGDIHKEEEASPLTDTREEHRPEKDFEKNTVLEKFDLNEAISNTSIEDEKKIQNQSETQSVEIVAVMHPNLGGLENRDINPINNTEELEKDPASLTRQKLVIIDGGNIKQEEEKVMELREKATDMQLEKSATGSIPVDGPKEEDSTTIENKSSGPENAREKRTRVLQAIENPKPMTKIEADTKENANNQSEASNMENVIIKQINIEGKETAKSSTTLSHETDELQKYPEPHPNNAKIKEFGKITLEESIDIEAADMEIQKSATASVPKDEALSTLHTRESTGVERVEESIQEEIQTEDKIPGDEAQTELPILEIFKGETIGEIIEQQTVQFLQEEESAVTDDYEFCRPKTELEKTTKIVEAIDQPEAITKVGAENEARGVHQSKASSMESVITEHITAEGMVKSESRTKSNYEVDKLKKTPASHLEENSEIMPGIIEDESSQTLPNIAPVRVEVVDENMQLEIHVDVELAVTDAKEGQTPENEFEQKVEVLKEFDLHEVTHQTSEYNELKVESQSEALNQDTVFMKHVNLEGETTTPSNDTEEQENIPVTHRREKFEINNEKFTQVEAKEMEEVNIMQLHALQSVPEDKALQTLSITAYVGTEAFDKSIQDEIHTEELEVTTTKEEQAYGLQVTHQTSAENVLKAEPQTEVQTQETTNMKYPNLEGDITKINPTNDPGEKEKLPVYNTGKKLENEDNEKFIREDAEDTEEATIMQLLETSIESVPEDKVQQTLHKAEFAGHETVDEQSEEIQKKAELVVPRYIAEQTEENDFDTKKENTETSSVHKVTCQPNKENEQKVECQPETHNQETTFVKHLNPDGETVVISLITDTEEQEMVSVFHHQDNLGIEDDAIFIQDETKGTKMQPQEIPTESVPEDKSQQTLPKAESASNKTIDEHNEDEREAEFAVTPVRSIEEQIEDHDFDTIKENSKATELHEGACQPEKQNEQRVECQPEMLNQETTFVKHLNADGETVEISSVSDPEEQEMVLESQPQDKLGIEDGAKFIQDETKGVEEGTKMQPLEIATESVPEDKSQQTLPKPESAGNKTVDEHNEDETHREAEFTVTLVRSIKEHIEDQDFDTRKENSEATELHEGTCQPKTENEQKVECQPETHNQETTYVKHLNADGETTEISPISDTEEQEIVLESQHQEKLGIEDGAISIQDETKGVEEGKKMQPLAIATESVPEDKSQQTLPKAESAGNKTVDVHNEDQTHREADFTVTPVCSIEEQIENHDFDTKKENSKASELHEGTCQPKTENEQKVEWQPEMHNQETTFVKHLNIDGETTEITPISDTEEQEIFSESHPQAKLEIEDLAISIQGKTEGVEEGTKMQPLEIATEMIGVPEVKAQQTLPMAEFTSKETVEKHNEEEIQREAEFVVTHSVEEQIEEHDFDMKKENIEASEFREVTCQPKNENELKDECQPETHNQETTFVVHLNAYGETKEINRICDTYEQEMVSVSFAQEKLGIEDDGIFIQEDAKGVEEATEMQSLEIATESFAEDKAQETLSKAESAGKETVHEHNEGETQREAQFAVKSSIEEQIEEHDFNTKKENSEASELHGVTCQPSKENEQKAKCQLETHSQETTFVKHLNADGEATKINPISDTEGQEMVSVSLAQVKLGIEDDSIFIQEDAKGVEEVSKMQSLEIATESLPGDEFQSALPTSTIIEGDSRQIIQQTFNNDESTVIDKEKTRCIQENEVERLSNVVQSSDQPETMANVNEVKEHQADHQSEVSNMQTEITNYINAEGIVTTERGKKPTHNADEQESSVHSHCMDGNKVTAEEATDTEQLTDVEIQKSETERLPEDDFQSTLPTSAIIKGDTEKIIQQQTPQDDESAATDNVSRCKQENKTEILSNAVQVNDQPETKANFGIVKEEQADHQSEAPSMQSEMTNYNNAEGIVTSESCTKSTYSAVEHKKSINSHTIENLESRDGNEITAEEATNTEQLTDMEIRKSETGGLTENEVQSTLPTSAIVEGDTEQMAQPKTLHDAPSAVIDNEKSCIQKYEATDEPETMANIGTVKEEQVDYPLEASSTQSETSTCNHVEGINALESSTKSSHNADEQSVSSNLVKNLESKNGGKITAEATDTEQLTDVEIQKSETKRSASKNAVDEIKEEIQRESEIAVIHIKEGHIPKYDFEVKKDNTEASGSRDVPHQLRAENEQNTEFQAELQKQETTFIENLNSDGKTTQLKTTNDTEEQEMVSVSHTGDKLGIEDDVTEEATKMQSLETATASLPQEVQSTLPTSKIVECDTKQIIQQMHHNDESAVIDDEKSCIRENEIEELSNVSQMSDHPETMANVSTVKKDQDDHQSEASSMQCGITNYINTEDIVTLEHSTNSGHDEDEQGKSVKSCSIENLEREDKSEITTEEATDSEQLTNVEIQKSGTESVLEDKALEASPSAASVSNKAVDKSNQEEIQREVEFSVTHAKEGQIPEYGFDARKDNTEACGLHEVTYKLSMENKLQPETHNQDTEINTTNDTEQQEMVLMSHPEEKLGIEYDKKLIQEEEVKGVEEAAKVQPLESATKSLPGSVFHSKFPTSTIGIGDTDETLQQQTFQEVKSAAIENDKSFREEIALKKPSNVNEIIDQLEIKTMDKVAEENEEPDHHQSEASSMEGVITKYINTEGTLTSVSNTKSSYDVHKVERIVQSQLVENFDSRVGCKITTGEATDTRQLTDVEIQKSETESVLEDKAIQILPNIASFSIEEFDRSIQEIHTEAELAVSENDFEAKKKVSQDMLKQAFDLQKVTCQTNIEIEEKVEPLSDRKYQTIVLKHPNLEGETIEIEPINNTEEHEKVSASHSGERLEINADVTFMQEESNEMQKAIERKLHNTTTESIQEDEAQSTLPTSTIVKAEKVEGIFQEQTLKEVESRAIDDNNSGKPENGLEQTANIFEKIDQPKTITEVSVENDEQADHQSEQSSMENVITKHLSSKGMSTTANRTKSSYDVEELKKVLESNSTDNSRIKDGVNIMLDESSDMKEATYTKLQKPEIESVPEDKATLTLSIMPSVRVEINEESIQEEIQKEAESAVNDTKEEQKAENDFVENTKVIEGFDLHKAPCNTCTENVKHAEVQSEVQSQETMIITHPKLKELDNAEISPSDDTKELEKQHEVAKPGGVSESASADSRTKEKRTNIQDQIPKPNDHIQENFQFENQTKFDPQMKVEHHLSIPQQAEPTSVAILITKEAPDEVDIHGKSENTEEQAIDSKKKSIPRVQKLLPKEDTVNQVKDHNTKTFKATYSNDLQEITESSFEHALAEKEAASIDSNEAADQAATGKQETREIESTQLGGAKEDEEGDEFEKISEASSGIVILEDSRDADVKISHKKSHGILSGVGSKVKHSISKVKKAITGKSSHPKTPSPK